MNIRVLGPVDLVKDGMPIPISSSIQRTLLALLIVGRGEVVSADHLVDAVWREGDRSDRRKLWFHVSKLRDLLGASVQIENLNDGYRLSISEESVDAWHFEQLVSSGIDDFEEDPQSALEMLRSALSLWHGEAYVNVSPDAIGWAEPVRLDELRLTALEHSFEARMMLGMYQETISALESLILDHPYRERLRGQLMRALYATGRQGDALRAYAETRRTLSEELGIEPSPGLQDLEIQILRQDPDLATTPLTTLPSAREAAQGEKLDEADWFVGRRAPLAVIDEEIAAFLAGECRVILIKGQAGTGKSALASEAIRRVQSKDENALVLEGRGRIGSGRDDPLGAVRVLPRLLVGDLSSVGALQLSGGENIARLRRSAHVIADALSVRGASLIGTLVSRAELRNRLSGTRLDDQEDLGATHGNAADGLVGLVTATARRIPLVVAIDDLHWADAASISVMLRLVDESGGRLLVVGVYRPEEVEGRSGHPLGPALNSIGQLGAVTIDLDEATIAEASDLIDELVDLEPNALDQNFRKELARVSEGNPLFALEFIANLKERGILQQGDAGWSLTSEPDWQVWPARVEGVLSARFGHASQSLVTQLRTASVEGEEFTAEVIGAVHQIDESNVIEILSREAADRHRLVVAIGPARIGEKRVFRYRFRHHLFQRFLYDQLDTVERSLLHGKVADALIQIIREGRDEEQAVALARHYEHAGLPEEAVGWLATAARHAIRLSANETAIELILRALDLIQDLPQSPKRRAREFELWLQLGTAYTIAAGFASAEVKEAFTKASDLVDSATSHLQQMQVFFGLFVYYASVGEYEEAVAYEKRTAQVAEASGDTGMRLQALHCAWPSALFRGDVETAIAKSSDALDLYHHDAHHPLTFSFGNHNAAVCSLSLGGLARAIHGEGRGAVTSVRQAIDLAQTFDHSLSLMQALTISGWVHHLNGDIDRAGEAAETVLNLGLNAPVWNNVARSVRSWVEGRRGSADIAIDVLTEEFELSYQLSRGWSQVMGTMLMEIFVGAGRVEEALALASRLFRHVKEVGGFYIAEVFRTAGLAHYANGEQEIGENHLRRAIELAQGQASHLFAVRAASDLTRMSETTKPAHAIIGDLPAEFDRSLLPR